MPHSWPATTSRASSLKRLSWEIVVGAMLLSLLIRRRAARAWVLLGGYVALDIVLLAIDPYANVGVIGAFVPGFSQFRPIPVALGSIALYALIFTAATAKWTRLLPSGWWLKAHRFAAVVFLITWVHAILAGTDGGALTPMYLATGLLILGGVAHRWWSVRARPQRAASVADGTVIPMRRSQAAATVEES